MLLTFEDGSAMSATTRMWGAFELHKQGEERNREFIKDLRPTPIDPEFTFEYFEALVDKLVKGKKRSAKALLTQDQLVPGLGNAIVRDILFRARLHPRMPLADLELEPRRALYAAILSVVEAAIEAGERYDEYDLRGRRGSYRGLMDKEALERPCPNCGGDIQKIHSLGGACYLCPIVSPSRGEDSCWNSRPE